MKVRKYLFLIITTLVLGSFIACGGHENNDPKDDEIAVDYNPIKGEWIIMDATYIKTIFTENFEWQESYLIFDKWQEPTTLRSYEFIDSKSFRADGNIFEFEIEKVNNREILTLTYPGGSQLDFFREK